MWKEKLLWGGGGALAAAAVTSLLFLAFHTQPLPGDSAHRSASPPATPGDMPDDRPQNLSSDPVARVGNVLLPRSKFIADIEGMYGDEYIQEWMQRTAVRLEAQSLGIDVKREEIEQELERSQRGYDSEEQFYRTMEEQLGLTKDELRAEALYQLQLEKIATRDIVVTESEMERYISEHQEEYGPQHELRFAQIVVETREDAESVLSELADGADFARVAADRSTDDATAAVGGDRGWMNENDPFIPEPLLQAAQQLPVGGISGVIELDDGGYAIILMMGRRELRPANDAAVRAALRRELALSKAPPLSDVLEQLLFKWGAESDFTY